MGSINKLRIETYIPRRARGAKWIHVPCNEILSFQNVREQIINNCCIHNSWEAGHSSRNKKGNEQSIWWEQESFHLFVFFEMKSMRSCLNVKGLTNLLYSLKDLGKIIFGWQIWNKVLKNSFRDCRPDSVQALLKNFSDEAFPNRIWVMRSEGDMSTYISKYSANLLCATTGIYFYEIGAPQQHLLQPA